MKDCYRITKTVKVCGMLDENNGRKCIYVEQGKGDLMEVDLEMLLDSLVGTQILIQSEEENENEQ